MNHEYDKVQDFKTDEIKAIEWIERRYEYWRVQLRHDDVKLISEYVNDYDKFKSILKEYDGDKNSIDDNKYPGIKDKLNRIDKLIRHDVNKLRFKKDIYITYSQSDIELPKSQSLYSLENPTKIDTNKAKNILEKYKFGKLLDLDVCNITKNMEHDSVISLRVTLPEGTSLGYFYDGATSKVILPSNCAVKITSRKISVHGDREVIFLKGELRDKEYVDKKISEMKEKLLAPFKKFDKPDDFIKLDFGRGFESYSLDFAEASINSFINNFPKKIYEDCVKDGLDQIVFTDKEIKGDRSLMGNYDIFSRTISIKTNAFRYLLNKERSLDAKTAILHEAGHVADIIAVSSSNDSTFTRFYLTYGSNLSNDLTFEFTMKNGTIKKYSGLNQDEFMAEVFKCMYSPYSFQRAGIKAQAEKAVKYIEDRINDY